MNFQECFCTAASVYRYYCLSSNHYSPMNSSSLDIISCVNASSQVWTTSHIAYIMNHKRHDTDYVVNIGSDKKEGLTSIMEPWKACLKQPLVYKTQLSLSSLCHSMLLQSFFYDINHTKILLKKKKHTQNEKSRFYQFDSIIIWYRDNFIWFSMRNRQHKK